MGIFCVSVGGAACSGSTAGLVYRSRTKTCDNAEISHFSLLHSHRSVSILGLAWMLASVGAFADCGPDPGPILFADLPLVVTCTGADTNGWPSETFPGLIPIDVPLRGPGDYNGLTVTVASGASVSGTDPLTPGISISVPDGSGQLVTNNGSITTASSLAESIGMAGSGETAINNGVITTTGQSAESIGIAGGFATVTNSGTISTSGNLAEGIGIFGSNATVTNSGGATITVAGQNSEGIGIEGATAGVTNAGTIAVSGTGTEGVGIEGNDAQVTNNDLITVDGSTATGIGILGDRAQVTNNATIRTTMASASTPGIAVLGVGSGSTLGSTTTNAGLIETHGTDAAGMIVADNRQSMNNRPLGQIETTGDNSPGMQAGRIDPVLGISINTPATHATVINLGHITTTGNGSSGIAVIGQSGLAATNQITHAVGPSGGIARITTAGNTSHGIYATGDGTKVINAGSSLLGFASIHTAGPNSRGIFLRGDNTTVKQQGEITTDGMAAPGLEIIGNAADVSNTKTITTNGSDATGIAIIGNDVKLFNGKNITTANAHGIYVEGSSSDTGTFPQILNIGTIQTGGAARYGIYIIGDGWRVQNNLSVLTNGVASDGIHVAGNNAINNAGNITVHKTASAGVYLETQAGQAASLTNKSTGVISSTLDSPAGTPNIAVQGGAGDDTVENQGTLIGNVLLGAGNDFVHNENMITGDVALGSGKDTFSPGAGSTVTGTIGGDGGVDKIAVSLQGDQQLNGDQFSGFEALEITGNGALHLGGSLALGSGTLGNTTLPAGMLFFDPGSVLGSNVSVTGGSLMGNGTVSGSVDLTGGAVAPGASTGILSILGDFNVMDGVITLEANSLTDTDRLIIGGNATLSGGFIDLLLGFTPGPNDVIDTLLTATALFMTGGFQGIRGLAAAGSGVPLGTPFTVDLDGQLFHGTVTAAVPLAPTIWFFASALVGLVMIRRRCRGGMADTGHSRTTAAVQRTRIGICALYSGLIVLSVTVTASAALVSRMGGKAVYDTDRNITWLADANLPATQNFGVAGTFNGVGTMGFGPATSWMVAFDFDPAANSFNLGFHDWRFPDFSLIDPGCSRHSDFPLPGIDFGFDCTGSEPGHLYYTEFGAQRPASVLTSGDPLQLAKFSNIQAGGYWSNVGVGLQFVWSFNFGNGEQLAVNPNAFAFSVWPVRDGDVAVPLPAGIWLFCSALGLLGWVTHRSRSSFQKRA